MPKMQSPIKESVVVKLICGALVPVGAVAEVVSVGVVSGGVEFADEKPITATVINTTTIREKMIISDLFCLLTNSTSSIRQSIPFI